MTRLTFGVFIPQGWKMELAGIDGAEAKWAKAVEVALLAEELGYDSLWVYDHFHNVPTPAHEAVFECWTTIAVISGGRLDWGVGAGWYDNEFRGYGYEFPAPKVRIAMLRETVEIVKAMWTEPEVSYKGAHYVLDRAQCDPKPLQSPHPPMWI